MYLTDQSYNENILIQSIELINFMCHDHLIINIKKPFTCIGGRNGSGKSAVMISLGILFGQRSTSLERGNSFKNLIKSGEAFFIIRCILNNSKKFMYDFFGDCIFVEKKVTLKTSSISVYNKSHKVWSNKVEDLEYLLDYFDLKFSNPLNYLTQEQSKKFLSASDPSQLYKFFLKGTEIEDIKNINDSYKSNVFVMKDKIKEIEDKISVINDNLERETRRMKIIDSIENMEIKLVTLQNELKWFDIHFIKKEADLIQCQIDKITSEVEILQNKNIEALQELEELKVNKKNLDTDNQSKKAHCNKRLIEISESVNKNEKTVRSIENDLKELKESEEFKKDLLHKLELSNTFVDKREDLNKEKEEISRKLKSYRNSYENCKFVLKEKEKLKDEEIEKKKKYEGRIYGLRKQIEYLSRNEGNIQLHPKINDIIKEINRINFKDKVYGPIAHFIKLKEKKWYKSASLVLNNMLTNFICFNSSDREILQKLFKSYDVSFTVLTPSNKSNNLIRFRKNEKIKTLLDVLSITDTVVMNQLIIMANIEQIGLIEKRQEAYEAARKDLNNIDCIYTLSGDKIKKISGALSDFTPRKLDKYYFENSEDAKEALQKDLNECLENKPVMKYLSEYSSMKKECDNLSSKIDTYERKESQIEREILNAENIYASQKEILNNENAYEELKMIQMQVKALNRRKFLIDKEIQDFRKEEEKIKKTEYLTSHNLEKEIYCKQMDIQRLNDSIMELLNKKVIENQNYQAKLRQFEDNRINLIGKIPEIQISREKNEIQEDIAKTKIEIEETKKIGNKEEILEMINMYESKKSKLDEKLSFNKDKVQALYDSYTERIKKREEMKSNISENASKRFEELTHKRGYKGELVFDHEDEKLSLKMKVHGYNISGSKDTLSGGERSFAAMSLLFSLWPYISCPVKILDEFDVFMDDLNRKFIIEKFIDFFKKSSNQVILITPLNLNDLRDDYIDIIVLDSPIKSEVNN